MHILRAGINSARFEARKRIARSRRRDSRRLRDRPSDAIVFATSTIRNSPVHEAGGSAKNYGNAGDQHAARRLSGAVRNVTGTRRDESSAIEGSGRTSVAPGLAVFGRVTLSRSRQISALVITARRRRWYYRVSTRRVSRLMRVSPGLVQWNRHLGQQTCGGNGVRQNNFVGGSASATAGTLISATCCCSKQTGAPRSTGLRSDDDVRGRQRGISASTPADVVPKAADLSHRWLWRSSAAAGRDVFAVSNCAVRCVNGSRPGADCRRATTSDSKSADDLGALAPGCAARRCMETLETAILLLAGIATPLVSRCTRGQLRLRQVRSSRLAHDDFSARNSSPVRFLGSRWCERR